jgi:hypothetical protein
MQITQRRRGHRRTPHVQRLVTLVLLLAAAASGLTSMARADGDPASDVLASQTLFLPQDAGLTTAQQAQLAALLATSNRGGYPIRVAIIAAPTDLGSVSALWRRPENYARFLGQELSLVYRGPLLVVMPNGYGVLNASPTALAGIPSGGPIGASSMTAIQRLAATAGHKLALPPTPPTADSASASADTIAWLVFGAGGVLIALAWAASLHIRPLGPRG